MTELSINWEEELSLKSEQEFINDLAGAPDRGFYAVGSSIFRREGVTWERVQAPSLKHSLISVAVVASNNVWAVGRNGTVVHFNGQTWQVTQIEALRYYDLIDVVAWPSEVWVTAAGNEIYRLRYDKWEVLNPPEFANKHAQAVWGFSPDCFFVEVHPEKTGTGSHIGMFDGSTWTVTPVGKNGYLRSIHGTSPNDVWTVGYTVKLFGKGGQAFHYDGTSWQKVQLPVDVPLRSVYAQSRDQVWVVGEKGTLLCWDGIEWQVLDSKQRGSLENVLTCRDGSLLLNVDRQSIIRYG